MILERTLDTTKIGQTDFFSAIVLKERLDLLHMPRMVEYHRHV